MMNGQLPKITEPPTAADLRLRALASGATPTRAEQYAYARDAMAAGDGPLDITIESKRILHERAGWRSSDT